jgi:hypothetical protein
MLFKGTERISVLAGAVTSPDHAHLPGLDIAAEPMFLGQAGTTAAIVAVETREDGLNESRTRSTGSGGHTFITPNC